MQIDIFNAQSVITAAVLVIAGGFLAGIGERFSAWLLDEVKNRWRR